MFLNLLVLKDKKMKEKIYDALSNIVDPEVGFDIVSLGLIYDASCDENGKAKQAVKVRYLHSSSHTPFSRAFLRYKTLEL